MRLSFELALGSAPGASGTSMVRVRLGEATLTDEHTLPVSEPKVAQASRALVGVLRRGNRARALGEEALSELRFLGEELHRALIPPALEPELRRGSGPLLLDLDEALVPVPFELLFDGEQFLCRRYALGRAVRTTVPRRGVERRALGTPPRALIIAADPRGDLADVHAESDAIVEALEKERVRARLSSEMGREALRRELKDFDLVHFAGHADFLPQEPAHSGWHLMDGKLTAEDVSALAGGRPMPLVVFSNACESGRTGAWTDDDAQGEARRAYGLAGAFLYAGVRHYVGTQWEVIDGHSATFATAFYQNLGSGQAIGAAVRHAREAVVHKGGEGALAWASYVLYGDPADRPLRRGDVRQLALPSAKELAARESAPWKRPTPQTMKRVGEEIAQRRASAPAAASPTRRALLYGVVAGLAVTCLAAIALWLTRPQPAALALLPIGGRGVDAALAGRVAACLDGALAAAGAPLTATAQLEALGSTTSLVVTDDQRALALGTALGARWVLWGAIAGTPPQAELHLLEVKHGARLATTRMAADDLPAACATAARALHGALR